MKWKQRVSGQRFIESFEGYKVSGDHDNNGEIYAAWPPKPEGNIYNPPRREGIYPQALIYTDDKQEAKHACLVHFCQANDLPFPGEYKNHENEPGEIEQPVKTGLTLPPGVVDNVKKQGNCKSTDELIVNRGISEGHAAHIMKGRAEKEELQRRAKAACKRMVQLGFLEFDRPENQINAMKPKALKALIKNANEIREGLQNAKT